MKSTLRRALMMTAFVGSLAGADTALAEEAWARCAAFQVASTSAVAMTKSCSDALYVRHDQDEANALCVATANESARVADAWLALKDLAEIKNTACATPKEAGAVSLLAAMEWQQKMLATLADRRSPAPGPYVGR